jgi:two-component system, OmpR family, response regulator
VRILLVEDYEPTASYVIKGLEEFGYVMTYCRDGIEGLNTASTEDFDAAIVDVNLPRLDGLTMISELRRRNVTTPVLILSSRDAVDDRVTGLQEGGDDYLTKPFSFSELLARIQALIRRNNRQSKPTKLRVSDLTLDLLARKVFRESQIIELQPREFALLEYLMHNAGRVVTKTMIMEHVWEYNFDPQTNVVEARIHKLRGKVDRPFKNQLIHTMRGVGYVLEER